MVFPSSSNDVNNAASIADKYNVSSVVEYVWFDSHQSTDVSKNASLDVHKSVNPVSVNALMITSVTRVNPKSFCVMSFAES